MCKVVAQQITDREGLARGHGILLPNCVTSGMRGMMCGNGKFIGCKPKGTENSNPNDA